MSITRVGHKMCNAHNIMSLSNLQKSYDLGVGLDRETSICLTLTKYILLPNKNVRCLAISKKCVCLYMRFDFLRWLCQIIFNIFQVVGLTLSADQENLALVYLATIQALCVSNYRLSNTLPKCIECVLRVGIGNTYIFLIP